jgi:hypothetical protein
MKALARGNRIRILILAAALIALALTHAPSDGTLAQDKTCSCDNLAACASAKDEKPSAEKPPKKKEPVKPTEFRMRTLVLKINPKVGDEDLPGLDVGTGTAEDTEHSFALGRASTSGHFAERRRFIYNTFKFGQHAQQNGEISRQDLERLTDILKNRLEEVNNQEKAAFRAEADQAARELVKELGGKVNTENENKTDQAVKDIEKLDLEQLDEHLESIHQVMSDNLAQSRAQELLAGTGKGLEAFRRTVEIAEALKNRVAKDCERKKIKLNDVLVVERMSQILGSDEGGAALTQRCLSRTLVARANFGGLQYEAKRCLALGPNPDRSALTGEWFITINGTMNGSGSAQIGPGGSGAWSGNADVTGAPEKVLIQMQGPVELVSGGGRCVMRLTSSMSVGTTKGYAAHMPGVSGNLPVTVVNEPCGVKQVAP